MNLSDFVEYNYPQIAFLCEHDTLLSRKQVSITPAVVTFGRTEVLVLYRNAPQRLVVGDTFKRCMRAP